MSALREISNLENITPNTMINEEGWKHEGQRMLKTNEAKTHK